MSNVTSIFNTEQYNRGHVVYAEELLGYLHTRFKGKGNRAKEIVEILYNTVSYSDEINIEQIRRYSNGMLIGIRTDDLHTMLRLARQSLEENDLKHRFIGVQSIVGNAIYVKEHRGKHYVHRST